MSYFKQFISKNGFQLLFTPSNDWGQCITPSYHLVHMSLACGQDLPKMSCTDVIYDVFIINTTIHQSFSTNHTAIILISLNAFLHVYYMTYIPQNAMHH